MLKYFVLLSAMFWFAVSFVSADHDYYSEFNIEDATDVAQAVEQVSSTLEDQGFEILLKLNFANAAANIGVELRPTTVIVAAHRFFDSRLIKRRQMAALDLPSKYLIFEDEDGNIKLEHSTVGFLIDRHDVRQKDFLLRKYGKLLNQFGGKENGVIKVKSNKSVDETVAALMAGIAEADLTNFVPGGIDFRERAQQYGFNLRPTKLIIFGTATAGIPLIKNDQSFGLDTPAKFLVFEDQDGQVFIAFNDLKFAAQKHNLQRDADPMSLENRLTNITNNFKGIAEAAAN